MPEKVNSPGDKGIIGPVNPYAAPKKDTTKKAPVPNKEVKPKGSSVEMRKPAKQVNDY